jgi:hypothetical protein
MIPNQMFEKTNKGPKYKSNINQSKNINQMIHGKQEKKGQVMLGL